MEQQIQEYLQRHILYPSPFLKWRVNVQRRLRIYYLHLVQYGILDSKTATQLVQKEKQTILDDFEKLCSIGICRYIQRKPAKIELDQGNLRMEDPLHLAVWIHYLNHYNHILQNLVQRNQVMITRIQESPLISRDIKTGINVKLKNKSSSNSNYQP